MAAGMLMKVFCVTVAFMGVVAPYAEAAITCGQVFENMKRCLNYLKTGGSVSSDCCNGVKGVNNDSKSPADKQLACNCVKGFVSHPDFKNPDNSLGLPGKCGVNFPYKFNNDTTECSKVK